MASNPLLCGSGSTPAIKTVSLLARMVLARILPIFPRPTIPMRNGWVITLLLGIRCEPANHTVLASCGQFLCKRIRVGCGDLTGSLLPSDSGHPANLVLPLFSREDH